MSAVCPIHSQPAKWHCGVCGRPVCSACAPVGLDHQVFHPDCVKQARERMEQGDKNRAEVEAPSRGVRLVAWAFIIAGILLVGTALFFLGMSLFGKSLPIRGLITGPLPGIDNIPGGRTTLNWAGGISAFLGLIWTIIGIGLINCATAARRAVLVMAWLEIILAVLVWLVILIAGHGFWDIPVIAIGLIWFLSRRGVRKQFEQVL